MSHHLPMTDPQWAALRELVQEIADGNARSPHQITPPALAGYLLMLMDRIDGLEEQLREGKQ